MRRDEQGSTLSERRAAHIVLSRLGFGPVLDEASQLPAKVGGAPLTPGSGGSNTIESSWLARYVDAQLRPPAGDEAHVRERLREARLQIAYEAGKNDEGEAYAARDEQRGLTTLDKALPELWHLTKWHKPMAFAERVRPVQELRAATWVRARHSSYQLREVLADFWHNHFHVNAGGDDIRVSVSLPSYDRDVIRPHCLGNFRELLEAVATAPAMLAYLNNASSKASPANENFARELFELHTLGRERYLNHLYNRWRDVPGATSGAPEGYIDQDVYEAARALTGWTMQDGSWHGMGEGDHLPDGGEFLYFDAWHDPYQKRVLGVEIDPNQPPMSDGRRVLDLVAFHPGTAVHLCTKLCRRLVSDQPPEALVQAAVATWREHERAKDQLARVVRTIVLHPQFLASPAAKAKRPFELAMSFVRAIDAEVNVDDQLFWCTGTMGQTLFDWPAPTGSPDVSRAWLGASQLAARWNLPLMLMADWFRGTRVRLLRHTPESARTPTQIARVWSERLLGEACEGELAKVCLKALAEDADSDAELPVGEGELLSRVQRCVALLAMSPQFQAR
jgi:uncharacterized protein (DUF1800 family)